MVTLSLSPSLSLSASSSAAWACACALAASACSCADSAATVRDAAIRCAASSLMVAASDEQTSSDVGFLALDGGPPEFYSNEALGTDPALASSNGRVFWIDRYLGNVLELDPRCGDVLHGPWTTSDADNAGSTNPQDIAVDPATGNLWVARFDVSTILVKSSDGSTSMGTIDLSGVASVHRNPYMNSIRIVDGKAYVTLEMLDASLQPTNPSYIVRLDVATALATRKVEATLQLKGRNPFGLMVEDDADAMEKSLFIAAPGSFYDATETDAGIEKVDLATFTSELVVRESDIGASVDEVAVTSGCGVAIVAGPTATNVTSLITFDPASGAISTPLSSDLLLTPSGFKLGGLSWLPGDLAAVGDGTAVAGKGYPVHVLSASAACTLSPTTLSLFAPQPPIALLATPP